MPTPTWPSSQTMIRLDRRWLRQLAALAVLFATSAILLGGCAEPGPKYFPAAPLSVEERSDGGEDRLYDLTGDGQPDYSESLSPQGQVILLRFDPDAQGNFATEVARRLNDAPHPEGDRHLVVILDSTPFIMVDEMWRQGRFRLFAPPSTIISPFPVMTDLSLSEFFGVSPAPAVESQYYDGKQMQGGYLNYAAEGNAGWNLNTSYRLIHFMHSVAYLQPWTWFDHELGKIQRLFFQSSESPFIGYVVTTSGIGAHFGRNGHQAALIKLDRFCQAVMHELRGRVQITLFSDHGHNLLPSQRIPLSGLLEEFGYRVTEKLSRPEDVVVPEFGVVTCAAIYTKSAETVAADIAGVEGIDLAMYRDAGDVVVRNRNGIARVRKSPSGYSYACDLGDPLELLPILDQLRQAGSVFPDGTVDDRVLFDATKSHKYPDALHRIWRAFNGLVVHTPDVLISVRDGWHTGSGLMTRLVDISATHGSLNDLSSLGFVMSTLGRVPDHVRMEDLRRELRAIGVPFRIEEPAR